MSNIALAPRTARRYSDNLIHILMVISQMSLTIGGSVTGSSFESDNHAALVLGLSMIVVGFASMIVWVSMKTTNKRNR